MKKLTKEDFKDLKPFFMLWSTQSLSQLGSSLTAFALTLWLYAKTGSSLSTAALTICSYTPYVLMSILAGAITDKFDKKKTMLICDLFAAFCTSIVLILYHSDALKIWHLYAINAISGLMNTVQSPASEVAMTLLVPKKHYQTASGLKSLSRSAISVLNPLLATALYSLGGLDLVIAIDLSSFFIAFFSLMFFIKLPAMEKKENKKVMQLAKEGLSYLKSCPLVLNLILFMSGVNLIASAFDAALPGFVIPNPKGGETMLGLITSFSGLAMILGSAIVSVLPTPKDRVRVVYLTMIFSLGSENLLLPLCKEPVLWCICQIIGWIVVPIMDANLSVVLRNTIPLELQGRVYACRNTLQFFTIPLGLFLGGLLVDKVCEPFIARQSSSSIWCKLFGSIKGSGAGLLIFMLGIAGILLCYISGKKLKGLKYIEK